MGAKSLYRKYGLSVEDVARSKASKAVVEQMRAQVLADSKRFGYSLFGFGWSWWQEHWTLKRERKCIALYKECESIWKTSRRMKCTPFEIACILNGVNLLLPEHVHEFRLRKVMTFSLREEVIKLRASKTSAAKITKALGISITPVRNVLIELEGSLTLKKPDEERLKAIALYKQGVTPEAMIASNQVTASSKTIYNWLKAEGLGKIFPNNTRGELRRMYDSSVHTSTRWYCFKRLARSLTEDTYKKHWKRIDPDRKRGRDWHLDHKVSVYKAFLAHWTPEQVAHKQNLQMLPELDNRRKFTN